jgi:hypothetical protein
VRRILAGSGFSGRSFAGNISLVFVRLNFEAGPGSPFECVVFLSRKVLIFLLEGLMAGSFGFRFD